MISALLSQRGCPLPPQMFVPRSDWDRLLHAEEVSSRQRNGLSLVLRTWPTSQWLHVGKFMHAAKALGESLPSTCRARKIFQSPGNSGPTFPAFLYGSVPSPPARTRRRHWTRLSLTESDTLDRAFAIYHLSARCTRFDRPLAGDARLILGPSLPSSISSLLVLPAIWQPR